jgi:hypothetical protein
LAAAKEKKAMRTIKAWHFLKDDGTLRDGTPAPADGELLEHKGELIMCESGLHASTKAIDALKYAPGSMVCRVEVGGNIQKDTDKMVCSQRTILWRMDTTETLHRFAVWCAKEALKLIENPDPRSLAAIQAKLNWLDGKITDQELAAARAAARDKQNKKLIRMLLQAHRKEVTL